MNRKTLALLIACASWGLNCLGVATNSPSRGAVLFNRDVRPILSENCFPCHGFDANKRKANLRLDLAGGAVAVHEGRQAVKPGDLQSSELWKRVDATDPKKIMPPPESGKKLKPEQVAVLRRWLEQGGVYQNHWSFDPPLRPEPPQVKPADWPVNDVDRFILATLEAKGFKPTPEARKETLIRRATLDLTGLPPTVAEVEAFLADTSSDAYTKMVDRLLASPRFGEHMARYWLDVARYGDTHGLHLDNERSLWPYRDWVVEAFNKNLPFDKFTVWQLAGDLLPNPTREQLIASGFNRCNVSTSEGGAIDEEFQVRYAVDRVETTSAAFMGLTMGCAVCHDHKLDPITQKEFYQMFSIFNNISENAMDGNALLPPPVLQLPTPDQEKLLAELEARKKEIELRLTNAVAALNYTDPASLTNTTPPEPKEFVWLEDDFPAGATPTVDGPSESSKWIGSKDGPVFSGDRSLQRSIKGLGQTSFTKCDQALVVGTADKFFAYVFVDPKDPPRAIMLQYHTDEWRTRANWGDADAIPYGTKGTTEKVQSGALPEAGKWVRLEVEAKTLGLKPGTKVTGMAFTQVDGTCFWDKAGVVTVKDPAQDPSVSFAAWVKVETELGDKSGVPQEIKDVLKKEKPKQDDADRKKLRDYFLASVYTDPEGTISKVRAERREAREKIETANKDVVSTMVSKEAEKPRPTWILIRGQYDKHGDLVGPGVPSVLPPMPSCDSTNRLTLARWLVDPKHPLTARVTVNRFWQQFFGTGIVKTAEDFGSKGEWPSHPELLDYLATEFIRTGWDMKQMVKLMVCSATYRQDSRVTPELLAADPENRLLGHGSRCRMDAEEIRDAALFVSGLLDLKTGGKGVRPYQPPGIWEAVGYTTSNTAKYTQDHGDALYRRSLYLFWKRTAPPPSMTTMDAPSREKCVTRRERTNTPLQALLTLNDIQYFEAARHLGHRMMKEGGAEDPARLKLGFQLVTARTPTDQELKILSNTLETERQRYRADENAAKQAIAVGESPAPDDVPAPDLAAYTMVANLLLNLDEVLTKN